MTLTLQLVSVDDPPVTVDECRRFCRLFDESHNETLAILKDAAIEFIEGQLREQLRLRKWRLTATEGEITEGLLLPKWPALELTSLTVNSVAQSLTGLGINSEDDPPKLTGTIPSGSNQVLEWRAGCSPLSAARKLLILQVVADYNRQREASGGASQLSIGTKLLLEGENKHTDAVRG